MSKISASTGVDSSVMSMYGVGPTVDWPPKEVYPNPLIHPLIPVIPSTPFVDPGDLPGSARLQGDGTVRIAEEDLLAMLSELKDLREKVKELEEVKKKLAKIEEAMK
jgi:hypothetical protein